jgi:F-type H+-transporting ATPase subunit b
LFLQIDGTLIVQIVNFVLFIVLLNIVFLMPVGAVIAKRRAYIDSIGRDIEATEAETKTVRGRAEERRAAARREGEAANAKARAEAQNEAAAILDGYQRRATEIIKEAQRAVAGEIVAARANEDQVVASIAQEMLERAIGPGVGV